MSKQIAIIFLMLCLSACVGKHSSESKPLIVNERIPDLPQIKGDTLDIDLSKSNIFWKGTKMRGAGKHEGEIQLKEGYLLMDKRELKAGSFVIDMHSITVTDIPEHEPIPRKNLIEHLSSEDFFAVDQYPIAKFDITAIEKNKMDRLHISGNLEIKGHINNVEFIASYKDGRFTSTCIFDRFLWDIAYTGSWIDKTFVDKEIELRIELVAGTH